MKRFLLWIALLLIIAIPALPAAVRDNTAEAKSREILERYRPDGSVHQLLLVSSRDTSGADIFLYRWIPSGGISR